MSSHGLWCPSCRNSFSVSTVAAQIDNQLRAFVHTYYEGWLVCDDSACQNRTRQMSVYGKRCLQPACRGQTHYEFTNKQLYTQILYFDCLFDVDRIKPSSNAKLDDTIATLIEQNREKFDLIRRSTAGYLKECGRRYVDMQSIFSFS